MNNMASHVIKEFLKSKNIGMQLIEPHNHCMNTVKSAIQTFKNNFIAGLFATDCDFPLHLLHKLLSET